MEEPLDQWFKDQLNDLPDSVPDGLDTEKLWKNIQKKQPKKRRSGLWVAAACIVLMLVGSWMIVGTDTPVSQEMASSVSSGIRPKQPSKSVVPAKPSSFDTNHTDDTKPVSVSSTVPVIRSQNARTARVEDGSVSTPEVPQENTAIASVSEPVSETIQAETASVSTGSVATPTPKKFRVIHINDVREEDENRPRLYRSDGFVRINIPTSESSATPALSTRTKTHP